MIKNHPDEMQADLRKAEWKVRTELAAAYRLVALFGWDDLVLPTCRPGCPARSTTF